MTLIEDGKGTGRRAEVDQEFRLVTAAITETEEHRVCQFDADTYHTATAETIDTLTLGAAFDGAVHLLQSLRTDKDLVIERIVVSASAVGLVLRLIRNPTIGTLTNNTAIVGNNLNFGSSKVGEFNAQNWDEVSTGIGGLTNGTPIKTFQLNAGVTGLDAAGSFVLPQNDTISIEVLNTTGGAIEFEVGIRFYFEETP